MRSAHATIDERQSGAAMTALLVPAALITFGVIMWRRQNTTTPVSGFNAPYGAFPLAGINAPYGAFPLAGFGSKLKKGIGKVGGSKIAKIVTKIDPVAATVHQVKRTIDDPKRLISNSAHYLSKLPGAKKSPLVKKFTRGARNNAQPEPGQEVVYQDVNGTNITKAEYDALTQAMSTGSAVYVGGRWAMPTGLLISDAEYRALAQGGTQSPPIAPPHYSSGGGGGYGGGTSYTNIVTPEGEAPNQPPAGGGGGSDYSLPPEAPQVAVSQQYQDSSADMPTPAPSRINPLIAIGTLIAVPVVLGMTKGH
jgi:hypothetical protein